MSEDNEQSRRLSKREGLTVALVAGLLGVLGTALGGVVGGVVSNQGAETLQNQEAERADELRAHAVRGAARLLLNEFVTVRGNVFTAVRDQLWHPADYRIEVSYKDRSTLAAEMSGDAWAAVSTALAHTSEFYAVRDRFIDRKFDYQNTGSETDLQWSVLLSDSTAAAIVQLANLGGVDLQTTGLNQFVSQSAEPPRLTKYRSKQAER